MPFANKFRAMMGFPFAGDTVGSFTVEHVDVGCDPHGSGRYTYPVRLVLRGPGGQQGVRQALKSLLSSHQMTFSAYGNAYQLWLARPKIKSLGNKRYAVTVEGAGARVFLEHELRRFLSYLGEEGQLAAEPDGAARETLVEAYLERYQAGIKRKVDRYRRKLRKTEQGGS
jgi:hypothetical protein